MTTQYTHTTFGALKSALSYRLGEGPSKVHWVDDELGRVLIETLQTYNAFTGFHRDVVQFPTAPGTPFYDLQSLLPSQLGYTLVDQTVLALLEYAFMEPLSLLSWSGSEKWTFDTIVRAIERRRNQFLTETQSVTTQRTITGVDTSGIVDLPDTVVAVTRVVWISDSTGIHYPLWPSDEIVFEGVQQSWLQSPNIPSSYSIATVANLQLQLSPPPSETGSLSLLTVESGTPLDPTANGNTGTPLGVPNDVAWGVRFGAQADLLRQDGPARDPDRAALCDQLYSLAVDIARSLPIVLTASINGVRIPLTNVSTIDSLSPSWESANRDTPSRIAIAGGNLLVLAPVPDGIYSVELQIARNAIIPSSSSDDAAFVQVPRDDVMAILAWAEMLCCFKSQGTQLENARLGSKLLLDRASAYNERRILQSTYLTQILEQSSGEKMQRPIYHHGQSSSSPSSPSSQSDRGDSSSSHQSRQRSIRGRRRRSLGGR